MHTGTRAKDTCCFSITVTCNSAIADKAQSVPATADVNKGLRVLTAPNPSSTSFRLNIMSYINEGISVQVTDVWGRRIESRNKITSNQALQLGANYCTGVYFARVI